MPLSGDARATVFCALAFARDAHAFNQYLAEIPAFAALRDERPRVLDAGEAQALLDATEAYIDDTETGVFSFGLWDATARQARSDLTHALAVAPWIGPEGTLFEAPPTLDGIALDEAQATWLAGELDRVRDTDAAAHLASALRVVAEVVPAERLSGTGFGLFRRAHEASAQTADAAEDGRTDHAALPYQVRQLAAPIQAQLGVMLPALLGSSPGFVLSAPADAVAQGPRPPEPQRLPVDAATAAWLGRFAAEHLASARSLPNLFAAARVFSVDGALTGARAASFRAFLDDYLAQWPHLDVFDFNKLERLAAARVSGNPTPLARIHGAAVEPGRFHVAVDESVKQALSHVDFDLPWIPHRFGYRAKQAAELVDILAERAHQGKGPLASLRRTFPEAVHRVVATTSDMAYNALIFEVDHGGSTTIHYLDSSGDLHPHARKPEDKHVLFRAEIDRDGHVHILHPERLPVSRRAYPLMNTYGLGDHIDVESYTADAEQRLEAKERYETRYQMARGTIVGFDDQGMHRVRLDDPDDPRELHVSYDRIRAWNNPHLASETDGVACTVSFDRRRDRRFADDLQAMEAIAHEHGLPEFDLSMSETALSQVQKAFLKALNAFTSRTLRYPAKPPRTPEDEAYHDRLSRGTHPMGDYLEVARGVCRHQFVREHMGKLRAGLEERFASGAANTYGGDFRGLHIWGEVSLADRSRLAYDNPEPDDTRYLSNPTWKDPYIPLWDGAYGNDLRRIELYDRTNRYGYLLAHTESVS